MRHRKMHAGGGQKTSILYKPWANAGGHFYHCVFICHRITIPGGSALVLRHCQWRKTALRDVGHAV